MKATEESNLVSSSMKIPVFDGMDRSKYQDWEDDIVAVLEYHDLEEYIEEEWKGKPIPPKTDRTDEKILQRKEMKKAKAIFVRATKELPNMIVKEADTPYEAFEKLREKYAVQKVREDFDKLDSEWNEFKITDISTDPDLIFKALEEQSRKLKIFGERYAKDSLQTLSKLKSALPKEYDHVFTYLNTSEERQKSFDKQLVTAKAMIVSHYKTKIIGDTKTESTMLCMVIGSNNQNKSNPYAETVCSFCNKKGHPKMKNNKPFCFKYKKHLKKEKQNTSNTTNDKDVNNLFITCITTDNNHNHESPSYNDWLGDTGAQCHIRVATYNEKGNSTSTVRMGNNSTSKVIKRESTTIEDEVGNNITLHNTRVVENMATNVISLLQLMDEGWHMSSKRKNNKTFIHMTKDGNRLVFIEGTKKNLCYLKARTVDTQLIANVMDTDEQKPEDKDAVTKNRKTVTFDKSYSTIPSKKLLTCDYNVFHDKIGHHGDEKTRAIAQYLGYKLTGTKKSCNACNLIKAKAKSIPRSTNLLSDQVGSRMGLDISGPFPLTSGKYHRPIQQKLYWYGLVDHNSSKMIHFFEHDKKHLVEFIDQAYSFMKTRKTPIKHIRLDNAGENQHIAQLCKTKYNINVEFTPPDTPKLNGVIERAFAIRWERAKILMQNAGIKSTAKMNKKIMVKAISTAAFLTEEFPRRGSDKPANDIFYGEDRKKHHSVSDSSCEAEYKELAKCAKGVKFVHMMLEEFNLVDLPGAIGEDNQGAIFLSNNKQVSNRTKHIDLKYHYIREFTEKTHDNKQQGIIFKIDTKENTADIGTKNVEVGLFNRHEFEIDNGMPELREKVFGKHGIFPTTFSGGMSEG